MNERPRAPFPMSGGVRLAVSSPNTVKDEHYTTLRDLLAWLTPEVERIASGVVPESDHDPVTIAGTPDYLTLSGQVITRGLIDLTTDVTGVLPDANVANNITLDNLTQITTRSHTSLSDIGTNTHATIDTHLASTSNPHSVTAAQIGASAILTELLTVDGAASGLDADLLDGNHAAAFALASHTHVEADITDLGAYLTEAAADLLYADIAHDHDADYAAIGHDHDADYQPLDATLTSIAALGTAADRLAYTTGVDTWAETPLTAFGRSILDDADEATFKATVNLEIGTDVQAFDSDLAAIVALASFTDTNWTDLTDAGATTLHKHSHNAMDDLTTGDVHTHYALLAGRAGGQTLTGGTASGDDLTLRSTSGVGSGTDDIVFQSGNNGATETVRITGIGQLSVGEPLAGLATAVTRLYVRDAANTRAAGLVRQIYNSMLINPASASSGTYYGMRNEASVVAGNAQNFSSGGAGIRTQFEHLGDGSIAVVQGLHAIGSLGPSSTVPAGSGTATTVSGVLADAYVVTTNTGTAATRAIGMQLQAFNYSPGTVTTLTGAHVAIGQLNGGSGAGTITNAFGLRAAGVSAVGVDTLAVGTITNATMVEVGDWTSGPTYTNPPEQLRLVALTPANSVAIRQLGTVGHNRFQGATTFGADAAPTTSAALDVQSTTGAFMPPRMTTTQRDALTASDGMVIYNTTAALFQAREAGAWRTL